MSSIFTKNFGVLAAKSFEKMVTHSDGVGSNTYVGFGRQTVWGSPDTAPTPVDTANAYYQLWDNLIGLKKVTAADINVVVPRSDWTAGTRYIEYNQDATLFSKANTSNVGYDNKFYVRNSIDQVFKCLSNNNSAISTSMPRIGVDGQLPENPYISTSDGYEWKYLYTIPAGLKEKFFTSDYMPVVTDPLVQANAVDGRIDIVKIITAGAGYNANNNIDSYGVVSVVGNGSNANITLKIVSSAPLGGNVVDYNILNGGSGYTKANLQINDPLKTSGTENANLIAVIGPPGGHGSEVAQELGASDVMLCVEIEGTENGLLPITQDKSEYRQISIIRDPLLASSTSTNKDYAFASAYRCTTKLSLTQPNKNYVESEVVTVSSNTGVIFSAVVEAYDSASFELYVNNIDGFLMPPATIIGTTSGAISTVLNSNSPEVKQYSGHLLYIDNTDKIKRDATESQQIKLTLRF